MFYMWMKPSVLKGFKEAGIIPNHVKFGKDYDGLTIIKLKRLWSRSRIFDEFMSLLR